MISTAMMESATRSLLMGSAVWVALKTLRVSDARMRKIAWVLVLAGALAMPCLMQWTWFALEAAPVLPVRSVVVQAMPVLAGPVIDASSKPVWHWQDAALAVYLTVAGFLILRLLVGLAIAMRLWQSAEPSSLTRAARAPVRISGGIGAPVTMGFGILLPPACEEWDETRLRIVLAHERSHVEQGDFFLQLLASLHSCLFWFSPLAWWLQKELTEVGEAISDEAGLQEAASRSSYAELLLEFATGPRRFVAGVAMARCDIRRRIDRVLSDAAFSAVSSWKRRAALAAVVVPLVIVAAGFSVRLSGQSKEAPRPPAAKRSNQSVAPGSEDSYVIVSGDSVTMSGSSGDVERARELESRILGDYIWFRRNGKSYFVDDPALVERAKKLFQPEEELGRQQAELGEQQAKLGEEQARLGELQARVSVPAPNLDQEMDRLVAELKKLQAGQKRELNQDELSDIQSKIGDLQSKLGDAQALAGEKQSELGEQQSKLGEQQSKLGDEQSKLGDQQSRLAEEAMRKLHILLDEALQNEKAKTVK